MIDLAKLLERLDDVAYDTTDSGLYPDASDATADAATALRLLVAEVGAVRAFRVDLELFRTGGKDPGPAREAMDRAAADTDAALILETKP